MARFQRPSSALLRHPPVADLATRQRPDERKACCPAACQKQAYPWPVRHAPSRHKGAHRAAGHPDAAILLQAASCPCGSWFLSVPQLCRIVEPLSDLALTAAFGRIVEGLPSARCREVVLPGTSFRRVVIVLVAGAVALRRHQVGGGIQDVLGRQQRTILLRDALGFAEGGIGG